MKFELKYIDQKKKMFFGELNRELKPFAISYLKLALPYDISNLIFVFLF